MAKKKRYRKTPPRRVRPPSTDARPEDAPAPSQPSRFAARPALSQSQDWAHEYRYVIADLRRMALTTIAMFALLFALAIVVPFVLP